MIAAFGHNDICLGEIHVVGQARTELLSPVEVVLIPIEFFVDLTGPDDGGAIDVGNFQLRVQLTGPSAGHEVKIASLGPTKSAEHTQARPLDIARIEAPTTVFVSTFNFDEPFSLSDQAGLMAIQLEVKPGVAGEFRLEVVKGVGASEFTDPADFTTLLPFDATSGLAQFGVIGDFDKSGRLDAPDIDLLSEEVRSGMDRWFDLNGDLNVDGEDRRIWIEELAGTLPGDVDLDGAVMFTDFLGLANNFGRAGGWGQGDFDGSGFVLFPDFLLLSANFGRSAAAGAAYLAVPEPWVHWSRAIEMFSAILLVGRRMRTA